MPLYTYVCSDCGVTEALRPYDTPTILCPSCGDVAARTSVNRVAFKMQPDVDARGMFRRFQEASGEIDYAYTRREQEVGHPLDGPRIYGRAKAKAAAMIQAGEAPPVRPLG